MNLITPQKKPFIQPKIYNKTNYALSFDGVDDYCKINNFGFSSSEITIEFWARIDRIDGKNYAFNTGNERDSLMKWVNGDTTVIIWGLGASSYSSYAQGDKVGEITHYALTYDGTTERLYINASEVDSKTGSENINFEELWIGEFNGLGYSMDGLIDEFRVWDDVRTQTEIQDNMYTELTGSETGLVAYYKINEGSGTTLTDSAGTNDGTIYGATWQEVDY